MSPFRRMSLMILSVMVLGGLIFLLAWDIPPPTEPVEITLPDSQFPS